MVDGVDDQVLEGVGDAVQHLLVDLDVLADGLQADIGAGCVGDVAQQSGQGREGPPYRDHGQGHRPVPDLGHAAAVSFDEFAQTPYAAGELVTSADEAVQGEGDIFGQGRRAVGHLAQRSGPARLFGGQLEQRASGLLDPAGAEVGLADDVEQVVDLAGRDPDRVVAWPDGVQAGGGGRWAARAVGCRRGRGCGGCRGRRSPGGRTGEGHRLRRGAEVHGRTGKLRATGLLGHPGQPWFGFSAGHDHPPGGGGDWTCHGVGQRVDRRLGPELACADRRRLTGVEGRGESGENRGEVGVGRVPRTRSWPGTCGQRLSDRIAGREQDVDELGTYGEAAVAQRPQQVLHGMGDLQDPGQAEHPGRTLDGVRVAEQAGDDLAWRAVTLERQ